MSPRSSDRGWGFESLAAGWKEKIVAVVSTVAYILAMDKVSGSNPASDF